MHKPFEAIAPAPDCDDYLLARNHKAMPQWAYADEGHATGMLAAEEAMMHPINRYLFGRS